MGHVHEVMDPEYGMTSRHDMYDTWEKVKVLPIGGRK